MRKWTKTAGLIFLAAASVYSDQAIRGTTGSEANNFASTAAQPKHARHLAKVNAGALPVIAKGEKFAAPEGATDVKAADESTDPPVRARRRRSRARLVPRLAPTVPPDFPTQRRALCEQLRGQRLRRRHR